MKKLFAIVAMVAACSFGATSTVMAQEEEAQATDTTVVDTLAVDTAAVEEAAAPEEAAPVVEEESEGIHKALKTKFIEGDAGFMSLVAVALVLGLAFCIERVIYLSLAQINTRKFTAELAQLVAAGKITEAIAKAKGTRGPVAQVSRKALECLNSDNQNDIATIERTINMEAEELGFRYAVQIDADGQLDTGGIADILAAAEKNAISHRARALQEFCRIYREEFER